MNQIGSVAATVTGIPGGVSVWSDGSFDVWTFEDEQYVEWSAGSVTATGTRAAIVRRACRRISEDFAPDVVLDPQNVEIYP